MTPLKYIVESKVATSSELMAFKRDDPSGFDTLIQWAREEMEHNGIEISEPAQK